MVAPATTAVVVGSIKTQPAVSVDVEGRGTSVSEEEGVEGGWRGVGSNVDGAESTIFL